MVVMPDSPEMSHMAKEMIEADPSLKTYESVIERRIEQITATEKRLTPHNQSLGDFATGKDYFGLHLEEQTWVFREWAPNATAIYLIGTATHWQEVDAFKFSRQKEGENWELTLPANSLAHGDLYRLKIYWEGGSGDRIPAWADYVVQDPDTLIFNAMVWHPKEPYLWQHPHFEPTQEPLLIYEVHPGMAQEKEGVGTWNELREKVLPRIVATGYNTIQLMAVAEHPYYASFGYQVASFFAPSSRFGTPDELKAFVDAAHGAGLRVIMDLVHSHAAANSVEGLGLYDGTQTQFFHEGARGIHPAWGSFCFDYAKPQVLHFLLSNCRYWLEQFQMDGFRFDGVTSMLYLHHGLNKAFTAYDDYFGPDIDEAALTYLALANQLIHAFRNDAVTIAEDVSGLPGLAKPVESGGFGFDYRFNMGIPDYWIELTKEIADEDWNMGTLWHRLTNCRADEKSISYAESHDQALVGDQTLIFRMAGVKMYHHMYKDDPDLVIDRAMALHKMIRLITLATAKDGYLNFMGNEFGHPEWIDFPREGNNNSYAHARRQWSLQDHPDLRYGQLASFDRTMMEMASQLHLLESGDLTLLHERNDDKVVVFQRGQTVLAFNFHPEKSFADYTVSAPVGDYQMILNTDDPAFGGHGRLTSKQTQVAGEKGLSLYLPARCALVLQMKSEVVSDPPNN